MDDSYEPSQEEIERVESICMPILKLVCDIEETNIFNSLMASCLTNWALMHDYDPIRLGISILDGMLKVEDLYSNEDEDEEE